MVQTFRCSSVKEICHFYDKATGAEVAAALTARHRAASALKAGRLAPLFVTFGTAISPEVVQTATTTILQGPPFHDDEQPNPQTAALPQRSLNVDLGTSDSRGRGRN
jgi:hypothetical protein